ncbi:uncharacterized protein JN550_005645 [Neoarthrinium moseri]|uniref:uncharacterized protein n=1 Tax=Neoarthrinium moseri TaxID=1658444 RepID=UPI001FDAE40B|nr:uncharacterized protein JN550_005645 [Neoarthrinium moseri]KAI1869664.1 hypothetical protein JN550_005645 [Neoarthrinium moseri]
MADPTLYLPAVLEESSITQLLSGLGLPEPTTIQLLNTTAAYHIIYNIKFAEDIEDILQPNALGAGDSAASFAWKVRNPRSLVLRISGKHLPRIKTLNEVATMVWVRAYTKIPIPAVVRFDATENNAIGHEFTLLEKVDGVSVDSIYDGLEDWKKESLVRQLAGYLMELRCREWDHCGGLQLNQRGVPVPGRVVAETFWQGPELARYWPGNESVDSLNVGGPYTSYTAYVRGHIDQYIRNMEKHDSLEWMRDLIPRLYAFLIYLDQHAATLNDTRYILTQRDLHFGNIMCDPETATVQAVLDWEFSEVLPLPLWSPGSGFLWNAKQTPESMTEQSRMYGVFTKLCKAHWPDLLSDFEVKKEMPHKAISTILNFVRAVVEVCPRGQKADAARDWRKTAEMALTELGV